MTFRAGDRVRVAARAHDGHHRTPSYVKGKRGRVERVFGRFANPETRAYGTDGLPEQELYHVCFAQDELWPGSRRPASDTTCVDIFEQWLEAE
jgi:nitrile hydratase